MPKWTITYRDGTTEEVEAPTADAARQSIESPTAQAGPLAPPTQQPKVPGFGTPAQTFGQKLVRGSFPAIAGGALGGALGSLLAPGPGTLGGAALGAAGGEAITQYFDPLNVGITEPSKTQIALSGAFPAARGVSQSLPKAVGPLAQRAIAGGLVTGAGGVASKLETGEVLPGALQGAAGSVLGAAPSTLGYLGRATPWGRQAVLRSMEREVLDEMGKASPAFKGIKPGEAYQHVVFPHTLQTKFSQLFDAGLKQTEQQAPGPIVVSPHLLDIWARLPKRSPMEQQIRTALTPTGDKFTITQAQELLQIARAGAYRGTRLMTEKATRGAAEQTYQRARIEAYQSIPVPARQTWEQTRILHGVNLGLAALLKESRAFKPGVGGPTLDPNAALAFMEKNAEPLSRRFGQDVFAVLHGALSRGGQLGERHDLGMKEMVPGILERSIVITRSLLKHVGMEPLTLGGTRPQPFTLKPLPESLLGIGGGQATGQFIPSPEGPAQ